MGPSIEIWVYLWRDATMNCRKGHSDQTQRLSQNVLVMGHLLLCLVRPRTVISIIPQFLQFIELELPLWASLLEIKIQLLDGPISPMLQLHYKKTSLAIDKPIWGHANRGLVGCAVRPQCIIQGQRPIFPWRVYRLLQKIFWSPY